jgi:hypothetical protein
MAANLRLLLETNVRITSFVIVCLVSAYLLMPTISETTKALKTLITNNFSATEGDRNSTAKSNIYIPPNYGGPDSQHGSGTR